MVGILVHGDNHFILRAPLPDRDVALALVRYWSLIQIGATTATCRHEVSRLCFAGDGAYSTVLALAVFARRPGSDGPNMTYTTGLELQVGEDNPFEVDFAFWYQRNRMFGRNEEPALVFGEAKSFGTECFKAADVARMRKLADKFPGTFMVFATLKDEFSADEAKAIGEFAMWGREDLTNGLPRTPVIALTGTELFCDWHLEQTWKELGGQRAALITQPAARLDNLHRLARFTQRVYLGLSDHRAPKSAAGPPQP
jgi:hypothetical protein